EELEPLYRSAARDEPLDVDAERLGDARGDLALDAAKCAAEELARESASAADHEVELVHSLASRGTPLPRVLGCRQTTSAVRNRFVGFVHGPTPVGCCSTVQAHTTLTPLHRLDRAPSCLSPKKKLPEPCRQAQPSLPRNQMAQAAGA